MKWRCLNPAPAPAKLIAEAGLKKPTHALAAYAGSRNRFRAQARSAWDVEEFFPALYFDEESTRGETAVYVDLISDYDPDVVVDYWGFSNLPWPHGFLPCRW